MDSDRKTEAKIFKSPKSLIKSPRFHDPLTNLILSKSPSFKTIKSNSFIDNNENDDEDELITGDQIFYEVVDIIATEETNVYITGIFYLFCGVFFWILSVQLLNRVMKYTDYAHPLFAAYLNSSFFTFFGISAVFKKWYELIKSKDKEDKLLNDQSSNYETVSNSDNDLSVIDSLQIPKVELSHLQIIKIAAFAAFLYISSCFLGTSALKYTSASNGTILATSSSVFSLLISVLFKIEKFTFGKLISVSCSLFGIILITLSTTTVVFIWGKHSEVFGDMLAIIGAFCYSAFLVLLRIKLGEQTDSNNNSLLYGYIGIISIIFGLPILLIFNYFNWEPLSLPENYNILIMLTLSSLLNALSDYCGSYASLITSPLSVSLSLSLAIPISLFLDSYFNGGMKISFNYILGIVLIFASFIFINISNEKEIVENAIENAIEEAINHDEQLSLLLSPHLSNNQDNQNNIDDVPGFSIDSVLTDQRLVVTGGQNHKYFFREVKD